MDHGWWWVVFLFFLTENDEVKQAVLSKYTLSAFLLVSEVQRVLLFVCLRNLLKSRTSCRSFCRSERLITLICCAVTDILGSVEPNTNQEIKFRRLEES